MSTRYSNPKTLRKRLGILSLVLLILVPIFYGAFRAYPLIAGPQIKIISPTDGAYVASSTFEVIGVASRASTITLQEKPITIDEKGKFSETLVAYAPYTILVLVAKDKYGKSATTTLRVIPH